MNKQAEIVSKILLELKAFAQPGVKLTELDKKAEELLKQYNVKSYNLNYHPKWAPTPFPARLCTSVNEVIGHGIPTDYALKSGDLLNLDIGIIVDGLCGDAAFTFPIGELSSRDERLLRYTRRAVYVGARAAKPGATPADIGDAIGRYASQMGFVVNKGFMGHGIGKEMHEKPSFPHFRVTDQEREIFAKFPLKLGDVICLEPMFSYKDEWGVILRDGWTRVTRDGRKSAQFEHMIEVTEEGGKILTSHFQEEGDY